MLPGSLLREVRLIVTVDVVLDALESGLAECMGRAAAIFFLCKDDALWTLLLLTICSAGVIVCRLDFLLPLPSALKVGTDKNQCDEPGSHPPYAL